MAWMGIGHTRIKHSPQVNWDQSTRSLLGCLKDPLISGLIQNISFEINWNLFCACQVLVAFPYIYLRSHAGVVLDRGQCAMCVVGHATHYPRGSSWEIDILPSRVVTDVKNKKMVFQRAGFSGLITLNLHLGSLPGSSSAHLALACTLRGSS